MVHETTSPCVFAGRFATQTLIKRSGIAQTLLGQDLETGQRVVVKTLAGESISAAVQMRLEHEAELLRKVDRGLLTPILRVGREQGVFYLVTLYQPGQTLEEVLRQRRLTVLESLQLGQGLFTALLAVHRLGVLHRNIKPANVIVVPSDTQLRAVLVDTGLAHTLQLDARLGDQSLQTVRYLAPEQAGLLDADVAEYSDLYSAGIVLFECLAGRPPFAGRTVHEVLRQHVTRQPPELRGLGLAIPRALDEVIQRLLRKEPRERYQTSQAVLADVTTILEALQRGESEPSFVVGLHDSRTTLTEPAFVGRSGELRLLDEQLQSVRDGTEALVFVEAESGGGKTRLLSEWALGVMRQDVWVLRGQAMDQIGQRPFQVLERAAEEIVSSCQAMPELAAILRARLGDSCEAVGAVLPQLADVLGTEPSRSIGPEVFGENRSLEALSLLLRSLGSGSRPAVMILDDCQWADELSVKLIRRWQGGRRGEKDDGCHLLLVAAFRSEEVPPGHLLRAIRPSRQLRLPPFNAGDLRQLVESMAGILPQDAVELIERLSDGSPFMASAVLRGMIEAKALFAEAGSWQVDPLAMNDLRSSRHAAGLLARRIDLLPMVAVDLLQAAAVLGKEFDLELAANLAGLLSRHAMVGLRQAQSRHLVWTRVGEERCSFVHDKVREAFLARLKDEDCRDLQRRAALQLEQLESPPMFQVAYLFDAAGDSARALPYALCAAEQARSQHSLEIAEQQYRIAVRGARAADEVTRFRISQGLGDVLMLRGHYDAACQMFEAAKFIAEEMPGWRLTKAQIEGKLGELAFKRGDMETAADAIEKGLRHLGRWTPGKHASCLFPAMWEVLVQTLHSCWPWFFVGRRRLEHRDREEDLLAVRLYGRLGHAYWFLRGKIPTLWAHLRDMNLAERYPPTLELAGAYSEHAPVMTLLPWYRRAEVYARRSLKIRQDAGDTWGQAQSLNFYGIALYAASRFEECIKHCREAVRLFQRTGDYWEMNMARYQIAASRYHLGELAVAVKEARQLHQSGLELGDDQASGISLDIWSWASGGKVPEDKLRVELARERPDKQAIAQVLVAEGVRLLGCDRPGDAIAVLQRAGEVVRESGVINAWDAPVFPWLTTALRRQVESLQQVTPVQREALLRRAERVGRQALRVTRKFQNDLAQTLRELALLAAMRGRLRRARRLFDQSLAVAGKQGARYEHAQTLLCRGQVGLEVGWPQAEHDVRAAQGELAQLQAGLEDRGEDSSVSSRSPTTLSLADRFDTVLESGRKIAAALSQDTIYQEVQDAAVRLLRGEQCEVVALPEVAEQGPDNRTAATGGAAGGVAADRGFGRLGSPYGKLVERALQAEHTVVFPDPSEAEPGELLDALGVRSALGTPIFVRKRPVACFYATHRQVAGLFAADEKRLAEFIAAIAGAALENAEGFEALQRLNVMLEQRVAERTADLEARTKELARSNTELEQFAYVASHDLREPLRTIASYCQMLEQRFGEQLAPEARDYVLRSAEAANRLRALINDLLTYSRVGTRGKPLEPADTNKVLELALSNLGVVIEETGATISHSSLPWVSGDVTQLIQLFQNLIANAIKFRGESPPQVHVSVEEEGAEWIFSVRDNGIGIAPEHFNRIFSIFQRLHGQKEYPGTGIGLAVCKKTVERHGGRIWVESEPGQGSKFCFTLLRCESQDVVEQGTSGTQKAQVSTSES
ncbi:MAG: ATP-binding protein [Planctomycetota bacterium]|nr:ATP-binding protein [Planctomycetota bacterium]